MPNWCYNDLTIRIQDKDKIINDKGEVDFNILMPMPEELMRTIAGGRIDECRAYAYLHDHTKDEFVHTEHFTRAYNLQRSMSKKKMLEVLKERIGKNPQMYNDEMHVERRIGEDGKEGNYVVDEDYGHTILEIGRYYNDLKEKYGCVDWYSWANRHWGTKWNGGEASINEDGGYLHIHFDTAWTTPDGWLAEVAQYMPFHLAWEAEEGFRGIKHNNTTYATIDNVELPMIEYEEDENGDYEVVEDAYGEEWQNYMLDETLYDEVQDERDPAVYEVWDKGEPYIDDYENTLD